MKVQPDSVLKVSLAAAALMAGAGVGYYYGLFLPQHTRHLEQQADQRREADAKAQAEAARKAVLERSRQQQAAQLGYQDCVNFAQLTYRNRWNASCRSMRQADIAAYNDCLDNLFSSESSCRRKHPVRAEKSCDLPADVAAAYAGDLDKAKAECLGQMQSGQLQGAPQPLAPAEDTSTDDSEAN